MMSKLLRKLMASMVAIGTIVVSAFGASLDALTLNGTTYDATEDTTIGILTVTDGTIGNAIAVPSGITVTAIDVRGGGALAKTGPGQLVIKDIDTRANLTVRAGKVFFARSAGVESLTAAAAMHLDASKASSIATVKPGDDLTVDKWFDVRDNTNESTYAYMTYPNWGLRAPIRANYQNGLPVIDTLTAKVKSENSQAAYFNIENLQGDDAVAEGTPYGKTGIKEIWEVFMVVEDNPGVKTDLSPCYQSFLTDQGDSYLMYWRRGADGSYWEVNNYTAGARNGTTWLDGEVVASPTTTPFPAGMHLLRVQRNARGRFKGLSQERADMFGGLKYGEMIAFRSTLNDATAAEMTRRLMHKWFGRQTVATVVVEDGGAVEVAAGERVRTPLPSGGMLEYSGTKTALVLAANETGTISADADYAAIRTEGPGAKVFVAEGKTLTVESLVGTKTLEKIGAGLLKIGDVDAETHVSVTAGVLEFARSSGVESLAGAAALHLDAAKAKSLDTNGAASDAFLRAWHDVRGTNDYPWLICNTYGSGARVRNAYRNGLPFVDLLVATRTESSGARLDMKNLQGDDATGTGDYDGPGLKGMWEVFLVLEDNPGVNADQSPLYQNFLTDSGSNWRRYWMRGANGAYWATDVGEAAGARNGTTWLDGQVVSTPTTTLFPSGAHLLRVRRSSKGRMNGLGRERAQTFGGMKYGEVVVFKETVDDGVAAEMTRRLTHKWFGIQGMGSLTVGANGVVKANGSETVTMSACTVARLDVTVAETLHFTPQTVTVAENGVANVIVPEGVRCHAGDLIPLMAATDALVDSNNFTTWTIISSNTRYTMKPKVVGTTLYAEVFTPGIIMVVR